MLRTEKGRRKIRSWETGTGFDIREVTGALCEGQWLLALSIICVLGFASVQQGSAQGEY